MSFFLQPWVWIAGAFLLTGGLSGWIAWAIRPSRAARDMTHPRRGAQIAKRIAERTVELKNRGLEVLPLEMVSNYTNPNTETLTLRGWFVRPDGIAHEKRNRCVILTHGLGASRLPFDGWMQIALDAGWNAALFDLRAHGISDGERCTFGFLESGDLINQVQMIRDRFHQEQIVLLGYSMGGVVALLALQALPPDSIDGLITVGTFSDFSRMADEYLVYQTRGWSTAQWRRKVLEEGERLIGAPPESLSPIAIVRSLSSAPPSLVFHGTADTLVQFDHGKALAAALGDKARFVAVDGADHGDVFEIGGDRIRKELLDFLDRVRIPESETRLHSAPTESDKAIGQ